MNLFKKRNVLLLSVAVASGLLTGGCRSTPKIKPARWNVSITKTTPASIEADLIGVTQNEKRFYEGLAMKDYWKPNSQVRRDADKLSQILQMGQPWVISRDDPKWNAWLNRGVTELLLVANLPEPNGLWRIPLCLDKDCWKAKDKTLNIEVQDSRIAVLTVEKAPD